MSDIFLTTKSWFRT